MSEPKIEVSAPSADVEMIGAESSENPAPAPAQETQPETEKEKEKDRRDSGLWSAC